MDQKEFIRRISELADIAPAKEPTVSGEQTGRNKTEVFRNGKDIAIDPKANPTWGIIIKKIKSITKPCDDCGKRVKDRKLWTKLYTFPVQHLRTSCSGCNLTKNPETGEFSLNNTKVQPFFTSYLNKRDK